MNSLRTLLVAALTTICFIVATAPAGAVEIGSRCTAGGGGEGIRVQSIGAPGEPTYSAPAAGIVTKWGLTVPEGQSGTVRLKVLANGGTPSDWSVLSHSDAMSAVSGLNIFDVRIAIAAGNTIGLYSGTYSAYCTTGVPPAATTSVEKYGPDTPVGGSVGLNSAVMGTRLALFAVIEPDVDGDGFGDESQDLCTQRADMQAACPAVTFSGVNSKARKKSLRLSVTTNTQSSVKLSGSARVPAHRGRKARTIRFKGATRATNSVGATSFTVSYPAKLRSALKALPRRKRVKLTFKLTATGPIDNSAKTYRVSLRGRAR